MTKKTTSFLLAILMLMSVCIMGTGTVSADTADLPPVKEGCNRYFFLAPGDWYNEYKYTCTAGIYWWEGADACTEWPGYKAHKADISNVYYYDVPKDVTTIIWNNYIDGGSDNTQDIYYESKQTINLSTEGYAPEECELYPEGIESFDGMIFVIDPDKKSTSHYEEKFSFEGDWYYYYGNSECGIYPQKTKGDYTISLNYLKSIFPNNNYAYYYEIAPHFYPEYYYDGYIERVKPWGNYNMLYAHFEDYTSTPEYIVFVGCVGPAAYAYETERFGDYLVVHHEIDALYSISHYVYVPAEQKVYTLRKAWEKEDLDITDAFESGKVGGLIGDADRDGGLTIKDATYIQKYLANFEGYDRNFYMEFDNEVYITIKDATAIQKALAGIKV